MNKKQKIILVIWGSVLVASLIIWLFYGGQIFTKTQVLVEKKDELFGTTYKVWKDQFIWGLDLSLVISGAATVISAILFFIFRRKKKFKQETGNFAQDK